jgi:hypothetical protein
MPILDVMPVSEWRDIRTLIVNTPAPSDEKLAEELVDLEFASASSFTQLRGAIKFLLENLKSKKKLVAFPKYICKSVLDAAKRAGYEIYFYDSVFEMKKADFSKIAAVFVVHNFGLNPLDSELADFIKKNAVLIEDFAHTFEPEEISGDYALFHFAKKVPNVHGGLLISFKKKLPEIKKSSVSFKEFFLFILKCRLLRWPLNIIRSTRTLPEESDGDFRDVRGASDASKRIFLKQLKKFRGESDHYWNLRDTYYKNLPIGYRPFAADNQKDLFHFPVLVDKEKDRDDILKKMRVYGIFGDRIWYNSDTEIAKRILVLPVTRYMREKDVKMICNLLKNV